MKKIKRFLASLDRYTNKYVVSCCKKIGRYLPLFAGVFLSVLVIMVLFRTIHNKKDFTAAIVTSDLKKIVQALHRIDEKCDILSFDHERNYVDFLTVKKFVGSEVGGLNLARPQNWQGPYIADNPTVQEKLYEIVKTKEGVFVIPGVGVKLPNGLVIGKDFIITKKTSIIKMIQPTGQLHYKGQALAAHLSFRIGDWSGNISSEDLARVSKLLEEFHEAMPYTHNKTGQLKKKILNHKVELPIVV